MPLTPPNPNSRYHQGYYKPRNPRKFVNPQNLIYRSGLELRFFTYVDNHPDITLVASEEIKISYIHPQTRKFHWYYPDYVIKTKQGKTFVVEVKPASQTKPPNINRKKTKRLITETQTFEINEAKWAAAVKWCEERDIKFLIMTEEQIDGKKSTKSGKAKSSRKNRVPRRQSK